jgi:hypothetical protein
MGGARSTYDEFGSAFTVLVGAKRKEATWKSEAQMEE